MEGTFKSRLVLPPCNEQENRLKSEGWHYLKPRSFSRKIR